MELLRQFVEGRDVPCPACGYNLRNTGSTRCPECGGALSLHVGSSRAPLGPWAIAFLAAAMALGFWLSVLVIGAHAVYMWWSTARSSQYQYYWALGRSDWKALGLAGAASAVFAVALLVLSGRRGRWATRSRAARWGGALAWTASLVAIHLAGMYLLIRTLGDYEW